MAPVNPDNRPLPAGWIEHYDASSCTWYYVCTNIRPPQVSTTHPLGPPPEAPSRPLTAPTRTSEVDRSNELTFPVAETTRFTPEPPSPRSSTVQPKASKLSFAQQLYASAAKPSQTYTPPSITVPSSIPTPPLSPPPNSARQAAPLLPNPPLSSGNKYASSHHRPSGFHNPAVPSQHPQSQYGVLAPSHSLHSPPSHHSFAHHAPHRAQSYEPPQSSHQQNSGHHRASTYSAGMMSKPKATPNFTTTLRPPPNGSYGQFLPQKKPDSTPALQTAAAPPPPLQLQHAAHTNMTITAPVPSYPSPPNSTSPASVLNASGYFFQQPVAPAPISPPQFVHQNFTMQTHATTAAPQQQQQQQQQPSSPLGQALGSFAVGMAGGALSAALSTQQGTSGSVSGAIGGALMSGALGDNNDFVSSNIGSQNSGANSQFQAALQVGQPVAEYQSLINSPMQTAAAQPTPGVNYQALVTQLQPYAQQQQPDPAAGQNNVAMDPGIAAYNAQLQASQQQYQDALNAQAQQMNAAAAQEAAQAQQAQALLQTYQQQQQQQQQHLQLQLQQQQQALHHQQALQQQLLQQQLQQMHAAIGQQPAQTQQAPHETPLGTFLTGFGQALSSFGDSGASADPGAAAADDGGGVLSFFTDLATSE